MHHHPFVPQLPGQGDQNKKDDKTKKKKFEPRPAVRCVLPVRSCVGDSKLATQPFPFPRTPTPNPTRSGRRRRRKGPSTAVRIPQVFPTSKCKLRLLKLERIKDFLLLEEEFIRNQEVFRPHEVRAWVRPSRARGQRQRDRGRGKGKGQH